MKRAIRLMRTLRAMRFEIFLKMREAGGLLIGACRLQLLT